jgi:hypothetical protein
MTKKITFFTISALLALLCFNAGRLISTAKPSSETDLNWPSYATSAGGVRVMVRISNDVGLEGYSETSDEGVKVNWSLCHLESFSDPEIAGATGWSSTLIVDRISRIWLSENNGFVAVEFFETDSNLLTQRLYGLLNLRDNSVSRYSTEKDLQDAARLKGNTDVILSHVLSYALCN